jgi:type II secretory pathway component GspD/PulD (secretin)
MTLVINQTPDIQEQVADLLQQLRRLQDLEVAIEIRLISLSEDFFERMGVNFDLKIKTDRETRHYEPQLVQGLSTGIFKPLGYVQDFSPSKFIAGITPAKTFTSDLDIPLTPSSFGLATPPFGLGPAFAGNTTGGMSFGLAFLSDLQVFFFLEAAQGDQRFNVLQSPKIMAFNGQSVSLNAGYSQIFVTGLQVALQGSPGGPLFVPNASVQTFGTQINVQPVVTGDRRFVRVNVALGLTNPIAEVPVFPIVVTVQPFIEGVGSVGNPAILTQFIQQPASNFINVQTTAVVPDGGTVLLGGLKRLSEGRNEFGPPILSKIPYLNRLVKNVGYGRETENILMMITPRIVINEEEEIIQTGVISSPSLTQGN